MKQIVCRVENKTHAFLEGEAERNRRTIGNELLARAFPDTSGAPPAARIAKVLAKNSTKKGRS